MFTLPILTFVEISRDAISPVGSLALSVRETRF